jgi:Cu+-exporting ATPase
MTCANCARHVTEALQSVPGVDSALVDLEASLATVRWKAQAPVREADLLKALEAEGYGGAVRKETGPAEDQSHRHMSGWRLNVVVGALGTAPIMVGEWMLGLGMNPAFRWGSFVFAAVVQIAAGARFYRGAWNQLKTGGSNMDTLVSLGSTTAFAYSTWLLLSNTHSHLYFMESAAIITLISVGHWMESRMTVRASSALRELLNLAPAMARRVAGGVETEIPAADLGIGDEIALRPGDKVPTDAVVLKGGSALDESMLTGESMPVEKAAGATLYAGTVNQSGRLRARVTATGDETALARIIAAVQRAQGSRAAIQRLGDRVSSVFVPVVVALAVLAALWWGLAPDSARAVHQALAGFLWPVHLPPAGWGASFIIASAVLIIACPCAMGLATPAAIMAGANAAARRGILIRDGVALEKAGAITAVLFDKTGTLTLGKPVLAGAWHAPAAKSDRNLALAGALARHSNHPISQAIARATSGDPAEVQGWEEERGAGVRGRSGADNLLLGSLNWMAAQSVPTGAGQGFAREWGVQGATVVALASNGRLLALFAVRDEIKPGAAQVIERLKRDGLKAYLVTGDNTLTARAVAAQAGIAAESVFAEIRPEQKAALVRSLQERGEKIAFVGDGINDAPALEQADLGIAVSRASDVAREAADIILLKSEIEAVSESLGLARATLRTIRQNYFWAFFYNAIGVPLAALGFMSPILCAAAMGFSDVIVIGNALRLRRWRE